VRISASPLAASGTPASAFQARAFRGASTNASRRCGGASYASPVTRTSPRRSRPCWSWLVYCCWYFLVGDKKRSRAGQCRTRRPLPRTAAACGTVTSRPCRCNRRTAKAASGRRKLKTHNSNLLTGFALGFLLREIRAAVGTELIIRVQAVIAALRAFDVVIIVALVYHAVVVAALRRDER